MFTGLIEDLGTIVSVIPKGGPIRLQVRPDSMPLYELQNGESIAVSGPCLTLVQVQGKVISFDVGKETVERTALSAWRPGRRVNMERAMRLGDRLGGHLVLGHIDEVGIVRERREEDGVLQIVVGMTDQLAPLVCEKGSISLEGVSLTVNEVGRDYFRVTLIPETASRTTLAALDSGDQVNLEADILARHLARMMMFSSSGSHSGSTLDLEFLAGNGYL